jgi:hypothetical protein
VLKNKETNSKEQLQKANQNIEKAQLSKKRVERQKA